MPKMAATLGLQSLQKWFMKIIIATWELKKIGGYKKMESCKDCEKKDAFTALFLHPQALIYQLIPCIYS